MYLNCFELFFEFRLVRFYILYFFFRLLQQQRSRKTVAAKEICFFCSLSYLPFSFLVPVQCRFRQKNFMPRHIFLMNNTGEYKTYQVYMNLCVYLCIQSCVVFHLLSVLTGWKCKDIQSELPK